MESKGDEMRENCGGDAQCQLEKKERLKTEGDTSRKYNINITRSAGQKR